MVSVSDNNPKSSRIKENVYPEDGSFAAFVLILKTLLYKFMLMQLPIQKQKTSFSIEQIKTFAEI